MGTFLSYDFGTLSQFFTVNEQGTAFAALEIFSLMEALGGQCAKSLSCLP
jgi:hypothetical protein